MFHSLWSSLSRLFADAPPPTDPSARRRDPPATATSAPTSVSTTERQDEGAPGLLTRTEVMDAELNIRGYEFALRGDLRERIRAQGRPVRDFLDDMLISQLDTHAGELLRERRAWLQLWEGSLQRGIAERLPPRTCLLLAPDNATRPAPPETRSRIASLRAAGFEVWLDDCFGTPWFASVADHASGIVLRMAWRTPNETGAMLGKLRQDWPGLRRAAWEVASYEDQALVGKLGCSLFSGGFVTHRGNWAGNQLSPQVLHVATLINKVRADADNREMAAVLKQDLAMSYRLLRFVNTSTQGLNHAISSIEQGLMVLGQSQLDRWLTLLLLTGSAGGGGALTEMALSRARFLELLGQGRLNAADCERLFVLGLFSMLDVALKVPLEDAITPLRLPDDMNLALLKHKGPFGACLALAEACERGEAARVEQLAVNMRLSTARINARQMEALAWVAANSRDTTAA